MCVCVCVCVCVISVYKYLIKQSNFNRHQCCTKAEHSDQTTNYCTFERCVTIAAILVCNFTYLKVTFLQMSFCFY